MTSKVVKIIFQYKYKTKQYVGFKDYKVVLACGHSRWLWGFEGSPIGTEQSCNFCTPNKYPSLEVLK